MDKIKMFYLQINVRIPNEEIVNMVRMNSVTCDIKNQSNKKSFAKFSESQPMIMKIISNVQVPSITFLRHMFETCLDTNVDDFSLFNLTHEEYLIKNKIDIESKHSDEITDCIKKVKDYQKKLKEVIVENFDFDTFEKAGNTFIKQLKTAHESPKTHLQHSEFKYFIYEEGSKEATLTEIQLDDIE